MEPSTPSQILSELDRFKGAELSTHNPSIEHDTFFSIREDDETIRIITTLLNGHGVSNYNIRIWLPEGLGTMDWRPDRLNIYTLSTEPGKMSISGFGWG